MAADNDESDSGINITLGKLVSYPAGVLLTLLGVLYMIGNAQLGGLLITIAGLFSLPVIRRRIAEDNGISVNRWATVAIVLILAVSGFAAVPTGDTGSTTPSDGVDTGGDGVTLITANETELLPTIDAFESGWRGGAEEDGSSVARYVNVENQMSVRYNVTLYDSIDEAESGLESMRPEDASTDDVSLGDGGFKYPVIDDTHRVVFRERNAVCEMNFDKGMLGTDSDVDRLAEKCEASINQQ